MSQPVPYQHLDLSGQPFAVPGTPHANAGKAVCIGRNYSGHAKELNNPVPEQPLLFIKPYTAMADMRQPLRLPIGHCHFETELTVLISEPLRQADPHQCKQAISGVGLSLDLTLRELQNELKANQHPWEVAKAFDGSLPLSPFIAASEFDSLEQLEYRLWLNGALRQHGETRQMLMPVYELVSYCSQHFTLLPGDVVLTGTPPGVGVIHRGDRLKLQLADKLLFETEVR